MRSCKEYDFAQVYDHSTENYSSEIVFFTWSHTLSSNRYFWSKFENFGLNQGQTKRKNANSLVIEV